MSRTAIQKIHVKEGTSHQYHDHGNLKADLVVQIVEPHCSLDIQASPNRRIALRVWTGFSRGELAYSRTPKQG